MTLNVYFRFSLIAAASLCFSTAYSDQAVSAKDTLVVTAAMQPLTLAEVASSVTIIDRDDIRRREARNVADLLRTVPGFALSQSGGIGSQTQLRSRGSESNHILVLINGVEANDPAGADEFRFELLAASDVERIEIIRGPQSALYGSEAVAGVINIITRREKPGTGLSAYAEAGSESATDFGVSGHTAWQGWVLNGGFSQARTDGENTSRVGDESDGFERTTLNVDVFRQLTAGSSMAAGARYLDADSQFDAFDFFVTGLPVDADREVGSKRLYSYLTWNLDAANLKHQLRVNYADTDNENLVDGAFSSGNAADKFALAYRLNVPVGPDSLTFELAHERTDFEQSGVVGFGDPNQKQAIDLTGFTTEYIVKRWSNWVVSAGARYENNSDFNDLLSGRLGVVYTVSENQRLRFNVGTGRKAPTFIERYGFFPQQFVGNADLEPENSTSFEFSVEQRFSSDQVIVDVTYFDQSLEDEINGFVFDPASGAFTAANEAGKSKRRGVEFTTNATPIDGVDLMLNYTYLDATELAGGVRRDEVRRPRHQGSVAANVALPDRRWSLQMNADYSGARQDLFFPPFPEPSRVVDLDPYWLLDLTLKFHVSSQLDVFLRTSNLLDEDYENVFGFNTQGRAVYLGARFNQGDR